MLTLTRSLFILIAVLFFGIFANGSAQAATSVAVVDIQRILNDSLAAQDVQGKLAEKKNAFQKEFTQYEADLRDKEVKLAKSQSSLSAEEFNKKREEFEKELNEKQKLFQKRRRNLELASAKALAELRKQIVKVVAEISDEDKFDIVMNRQDIILVETSLEITDKVLKKLNETVKTINIEE